MSGLPYWICMAVILTLLIASLVRMGGASLFVLRGYRHDSGTKIGLLIAGLTASCFLLLVFLTVPFGLTAVTVLCLCIATHGARRDRFETFSLLALVVCVVGFLIGVIALNRSDYGGEIGYYSGYFRDHELFTGQSLTGMLQWHPALDAIHVSAHRVFRLLALSVLAFLLAIVLSAISLLPVRHREPNKPASGRLMALCILLTSICWLVIYALLLPVSGEARGMLSVPPGIELPVVGRQFSRRPWKLITASLEQEVHAFIDVDGRILGPGGSPIGAEQVLTALTPRLDIREGPDGLRRNYEPFLVAIDAFAQPSEFLPALRALRDAGVETVRVVGRCGDCSIKSTHGIQLAFPGQCRLTLTRTEAGWLCDGVRADRVNAGPGDRNNPWKRVVAVDLTKVNQWSEVTSLLELSFGLMYPIALLLPGLPPTEIEEPR